MTEPRRSFYIVLPLIAVIATLLLAELAFRLVYPVPFSLEKNMYYEPDPHTGFRHRPLSEGSYLNGVPAIANSRGLRDDEVAVPKPDGLFRILMVGDSFTAGANVPQDDAYPQVLDQLLGDSIEVVNTGTGGWSPFQYAQFVEHYGDEYEPDMVLLGLFVGNDIYVDRFAVEDTLTAVLGRRVSRKTGQGLWGGLKVWLYEHSHIARLALTQSFDTTDFARADCGDFDEVFVALQAGRVMNHLDRPTDDWLAVLEKNVGELTRVRDWAAARSIPFIVYVFPDENQLNPLLQDAVLKDKDRADYDFAKPQSLLKPLFTLNGIKAVDLTPAIAADSRCLFMNDTHWTAEGHALVAGAIRDHLRANYLQSAP